MSNRFRTSNVTLGIAYPDGRQPTRLEMDYNSTIINLTGTFVTPVELSAAIDDIDTIIGYYVPSSSFTSGTIISMISGNSDSRYILTGTTLGAIQNLSTSLNNVGGLFLSGLYRGTPYSLIISSSATRQLAVAGAGTAQANIRIADLNAQGGFVSYTSGSALTERYAIGKRSDDVFVISDPVATGDFLQYTSKVTSGTLTLNALTRFGINTTPSIVRFEIQTLSQSNDAVRFYSSNEGNNFWLNPSFGPGAFSPMAQRGDGGIIFYSGSGANTGSFIIAQFSPNAKGIRIDTSGNLGVNLAIPTHPLTVQGDLSSSGQAIFAGGYKMPLVNLSITSSLLSGTQSLRNNLYGVRVPWSGSIAGLSCVSSSVLPTGSLFLRAQINGGDVAGTVLTASTINPFSSFGRGIFTFSAGDIIGVAVNTQNFVQVTGSSAPFIGYFITMWAYM
jgi:hypothetical protein